ncbi:hypothetical protein KAI46_15960, partial [bacterium]|nr:hypothetical protein [bacterium]
MTSAHTIEQIWIERQRLVYAATPMAAAAIVIAVSFIAYLMAERLPSHLIYPWMGSMFIVAAVRVLVFYFFSRETTDHKNPVWRKLCILLSTLTGAGWGGAVFLFMPYLEPIQQLTFTLILVAYLSGALTTHFPLPLAFAGLFYLILIPLVFRQFEVGGKLGNSLGFLLIVFATFVAMASRRLKIFLVKALQLRFENRALADSIETEKND